MTLLGFDYGRRRIGVSVGNRLTGTARELTVIDNNDTPDWEGIAKLIKDWQPEALVIGLPLDASGHEQDITRDSRKFASQLEQRHKLRVHMMDERYTSVEAESQLKAQRQAGVRKRLRKGDSDRAAARLILENWLQLNSS